MAITCEGATGQVRQIVHHHMVLRFHLDGYTTADNIGSIAGLGGTVVLAALLLLLPTALRPGSRPVRAAGDRDRVGSG